MPKNELETIIGNYRNKKRQPAQEDSSSSSSRSEEEAQQFSEAAMIEKYSKGMSHGEAIEKVKKRAGYNPLETAQPAVELPRELSASAKRELEKDDRKVNDIFEAISRQYRRLQGAKE